MERLKPVELCEGLWWVGSGQSDSPLYCNPYLYCSKGSTILFDPGSVLDADDVVRQVESIVPIESIDAIVASHQDPDLCASIPLFEAKGFKGVICCHERAATLIRYYGVSSGFYPINQNKYRYQLADGTYLYFIFAPYLHFPGAIMTYIPSCKALISGDLFGAVTEQWKLIAEEDYEEAMKTFHESYMPSHEILGPVMNQLAAYDIDIICPQHGSVIDSNVTHYIDILKNLTCGRFMQPVRTRLLEEGGVIRVCDIVLKRYFAVYGQKAVRQVFAKSPFVIDYENKSVKSCSLPDDDIWCAFFDQVQKIKGNTWITVVSPIVENLSAQYDLPLPVAFSSIIYDIQKQKELFTLQYQELEQQKQQLEQSLKEVEDALAFCPITKLYNQNFYELFIANEMKQWLAKPFLFSVTLFSIDNLADINLDFGSTEGDNTMRSLTVLLQRSLTEFDRAFRLEGGTFAVFSTNVTRKLAIEHANAFKNIVSESELFIVPTTISMGLFHADDLAGLKTEDASTVQQIVVQTARFRLRLAKKRGRNSFVYDSSQTTGTQAVYSVLLIDFPGIQRDLIQRALERSRYHVSVTSDGLAARKAIEENSFDIIVSELMIPKLGALTLRKELLKIPARKRIPFILMSANKNEDTVRRALNLGISHFLVRPVLMVELVGIIDQFAAQAAVREGF